LKKEHRSIVDIVDAAVGRGSPLVQSPASGLSYNHEKKI
jgi:hypothetical protein